MMTVFVILSLILLGEYENREARGIKPANKNLRPDPLPRKNARTEPAMAELFP